MLATRAPTRALRRPQTCFAQTWFGVAMLVGRSRSSSKERQRSRILAHHRIGHRWPPRGKIPFDPGAKKNDDLRRCLR
jgi:hypothetical protein